MWTKSNTFYGNVAKLFERRISLSEGAVATTDTVRQLSDLGRLACRLPQIFAIQLGPFCVVSYLLHLSRFRFSFGLVYTSVYLEIVTLLEFML